jgi:HSP20 family protein
MSLINRVFPEVSRAFSLLDEPIFNVARRSVPTFFPLNDRQSFFRPSVDISETDKNYIVEAEVPGMKKENLSVEFLNDGHTLVMKGKIDHASEQSSTEGVPTSDGGTKESLTSTDAAATDANKPTFWTSERTRGHFQRSFQFPGTIDPENVKASYKDGVLSIVVPKVERHGKQISIE